MKEYIYNITWTMSMLLSVLTGGDRYQPVSARAHASKWWISEQLCKLLNYWDPKHCVRSYKIYRVVRTASRKGGRL